MEQQQQGTSTPTGVAATDPMQMQAGKPEEGRNRAKEIGEGIEANIPGGRLAQRGVLKSRTQAQG